MALHRLCLCDRSDCKLKLCGSNTLLEAPSKLESTSLAGCSYCKEMAFYWVCDTQALHHGAGPHSCEATSTSQFMS